MLKTFLTELKTMVFEAGLIAKILGIALFYTAWIDWSNGNKQDGSLLFWAGNASVLVGAILL